MLFVLTLLAFKELHVDMSHDVHNTKKTDCTLNMNILVYIMFREECVCVCVSVCVARYHIMLREDFHTFCS